MDSLLSLYTYAWMYEQRLQASNTLSTALYTRDSSIDFTTRAAKILARTTGMPVYVGGSVSFGGPGMGATVEEEVEGLKAVIDVVVREVERKRDEGP